MTSAAPTTDLVKLTDADQKVLAVVQQQMGVGITPTAIGVHLGHAYAAASSRVAPSLRKLCDKGLVRRVTNDDRKVCYVAS